MKPHEILGVSETATREEIRKAYKRLSMQYHPDRESGDEDRFVQITKAYAILSKAKCALCNGTGRIREHRGFFTTEKYCPRCWGAEK